VNLLDKEQVALKATDGIGLYFLTGIEFCVFKYFPSDCFICWLIVDALMLGFVPFVACFVLYFIVLLFFFLHFFALFDYSKLLLFSHLYVLLLFSPCPISILNK